MKKEEKERGICVNVNVVVVFVLSFPRYFAYVSIVASLLSLLTCVRLERTLF